MTSTAQLFSALTTPERHFVLVVSGRIVAIDEPLIALLALAAAEHGRILRWPLLGHALLLKAFILTCLPATCAMY